MPGDDDSAAGVPEAQALLQGLLAQPAAQEATHERVPGSHDVEHLYGKPGTLTPSSTVSRISPGKTMAPIAPTLSTMVPPESPRMLRSASMVSVEPPAIRISSSVPTTRSQPGSTER